MGLFGVDMAGMFASALGSHLEDATIAKIVPGTYDLDNPAGGNRSSSTNYTCKGVASKVISEFVDADKVRRFAGEVTILLGTVSTAGIVPDVGDAISIPHPSTRIMLTGIVSKVDVDPAGVSAVCKIG